MCTVLLPPDVNATAVNKYIITFRDIKMYVSYVKKCYVDIITKLFHQTDPKKSKKMRIFVIK